ncbi:MAG TPA: FGGY family carbohydrate kinase [Streptosporangiaceae bacterium]|nr:FGGY family carbohydrate kinase [Streptosporangiaceae bacterium]
MGSPVLVGIDIGTTTTKAAVFDESGKQLASALVRYAIRRPRPGWAEQDPSDWWHATEAALRQISQIVRLVTVRAVGVVSQVNTHAFIDRHLRPVAPAIVWQDQRCAAIACSLNQRFDPNVRQRIWGSPFTIDSSYLVSRAAWLAYNNQAAWDTTAWVVSPKDYVISRLTGTVATDAPSSIGLVDPTGMHYLPVIDELLPGTLHRLPPLARPDATVGRVAPAAAAATGLSAGVPVVVGTMDAWGNLHGSAAVTPGDAILVAGTSEIAAIVSDRTHPTVGVITFPPYDGLIVHAGPTQAGGDALRWWVETRGTTFDDVLAEAATAPPGAGGVVFAPHLLGERAPLWDPLVRASFLGVSSDTTSADLARAVLEGVAFSDRELFEAVERAAGVPVTSVALSGGGAQSDLWSQIRADVVGRSLNRLRVRDSAVLGAALLGAVGSGVFPTLADATADAVHIDQVFEPDPHRAARYRGLYDAYRGAYQALKPIHATLDQWRATAP